MIFIDKEQTVILVPKHEQLEGTITLNLKHNMTGAEFSFACTDTGRSSNYWIFNNMDFRGLSSGEYMYNLNGLETGLLHVKTDESEKISYNTEKTIIQYE